MSDIRKAAEDLLEGVEAAIKAGDWKVDGACDLDLAIVRLRQALAQPESDCYGYASRLATYIWEKHYKEDSPEWKPFNNLEGVLTQIDNMVCGLVKAQPEQEPVAWMDEDGDVLSASIGDGTGLRNIPLYTAPPKREWVGLTDNEVEQIGEHYSQDRLVTIEEAIRHVESVLKEKNA